MLAESVLVCRQHHPLNGTSMAIMNLLPASLVTSWHAHVYFDASTRGAAWALRESIEVALGDRLTMGRFHEKPVGPHPMWSYQLGIPVANFAEVIAWLALNHAGLDVFAHPNTDDELRDHRDSALWLGRSHTLNLAALMG
ncbi:MAG: 4,5-dioxygenase [Rhizobacter sp.]|nr:4,5-dioxygenase [Rhizobacter sp.]